MVLKIGSFFDLPRIAMIWFVTKLPRLCLIASLCAETYNVLVSVDTQQWICGLRSFLCVDKQ